MDNLRSVVDFIVDIKGSTSNFPPQPWIPGIPLDSLEFPGIPGIPEALFSKWEFQVTNQTIWQHLLLLLELKLAGARAETTRLQYHFVCRGYSTHRR